MKNNKGFSLLELIIIIAIMGVVLLYGTPRVDSLFGYSAREANSKIYNGVTNFKTSYMGKSRSQETQAATSVGGVTTVNPNLDMYMEIYKDSKDIYYVKFFEKGADAKVEKLGPKRIKITYKIKGDSTMQDVGTEGHGLVIAFDRSTGGFLAQGTNGLTGQPAYVQYIYCSSGTKTYTNELMPKTGKIKTVK